MENNRPATTSGAQSNETYSSPSKFNEQSTCLDFTFSTSLRSPEGPMRGRSVKEFEEQFALLRKENFDLKLRIYFLEERMGANFTLDKEEIVKNNIELMVQLESLKRELQEKHELLCQAVKAMDLEEEEFKKTSQAKNDEILALTREIEDLRGQLQEDNASSQRSCHSEPIFLSSQVFSLQDSTANKMRDLQEKIVSLETELTNEKKNSASLQLILDQADLINEKYDQLRLDLEEKNNTIANMREENKDSKEKLSQFSLQIKNMEKKAEQTKTEIKNLLKLLNEKSKTIAELEEHMGELEKKRSNFLNELDKEKQKCEKIKLVNEMKLSEMEEELDKQRGRVQELQKKLGSAHQELKDNQNLLVPKSPNKSAQSSENNDFNHVSVPNAATSSGLQKEDALCNALGSLSPQSKSSVAFDFNGIHKILSKVDFEGKSQLMELLRQLQEVHSKSVNRNLQFKAQELKACAIIKNLMQYRKTADKQTQEYKKKIEKLEKELEGVVSKPLNSSPSDFDTSDHNKVVTELEDKIKSLELTSKEKEIRMEFSEAQNVELLNKIKEKENDIVNLATKMSEKGTENAAEKSNKIYQKLFDEKNKEIEKLNEDLRKRTCDLQVVVNKELWQKNKEIEKLQNKYAQLLDNKEREMLELKQDFSSLSKSLEELKSENRLKHSENSNLRTTVAELQYQWDTLVEKIGQIGLISEDNNLEIEIVISSLDEVKNMQLELEEVKSEKARLVKKIDELENIDKRHNLQDFEEEQEETTETLKRNLEVSETLRSQSNQACHMLRTQLEELATFLDSLMKEKSVLGFLGLSKNRKWREVIDQSLNLSRSLDLSLNFNNPEQSLLQLSNITGLLDGSSMAAIDEDNDVKNFSATSDKASWICDDGSRLSNVQEETGSLENFRSLREQVATLQKELKTKNNELSRLRRESRNGRDLKLLQPKLRISPNNKGKSPQLANKPNPESESEAWSEPDVNVSKARIGLFLEDNGSVTGVEELQSTDSTDESLDVKRSDILDECQITVAKLNRQISDLQDKLEEKERLCLELQESNALTKEDQELTRCALEEVKIKLQEVSNEKEEIERKFEVSKNQFEHDAKETNDKINQLKFEREQLVTMLRDYSNMTESSRQEVVMIEKKLTLLLIEKENSESKLRQEYEELLNVKLEEYEKNFVDKFNEMRSQAEDELEVLRRNISDSTKYYVDNYVKKSDVEEQMREIENLNGELATLRESFVKYRQVAEHSANVEKKMKEEINNLQAKLNQASLQCSELQLEKAQSERKMVETMGEKSELEAKLEGVLGELEALQEEINLLKCYKSKLEVKMSELELNNADLHNKLVRAQNGGQDNNREIEAASNSSPDAQAKRRSIFSVVIPQDAERSQATSSPDLGIESDQGRFSSLEAAQSKAQRPLGETLELTRSLNDLLEIEDLRQAETGQNTCANKFCNERSNELVQENNALKKNLAKTRKALEDTVSQLTMANQRKKQVEKNICRQIHKTSQVLREAKANLDSGSDLDPQRKG